MLMLLFWLVGIPILLIVIGVVWLGLLARLGEFLFGR